MQSGNTMKFRLPTGELRWISVYWAILGSAIGVYYFIQENFLEKNKLIFSKSGDNFEDIEVILRNQLSLKSAFKVKSDIDDVIENAILKDNNVGFIVMILKFNRLAGIKWLH